MLPNWLAAGDTVLRRQVSTRPEKTETFFQQLTEMDKFMAILEVYRADSRCCSRR